MFTECIKYVLIFLLRGFFLKGLQRTYHLVFGVCQCRFKRPVDMNLIFKLRFAYILDLVRYIIDRG